MMRAHYARFGAILFAYIAIVFAWASMTNLNALVLPAFEWFLAF